MSLTSGLVENVSSSSVDQIRAKDTELPCTGPAHVPSESWTSTRIGGAYANILLAWAVISLPMIVLSCILLGLVLGFQVVPPVSLSKYLVDFSATRLITVASWTSSIAPLLPTFIVTLLSYPAASNILWSSKEGRATSLLTPFQLGLYLKSLSGGAECMWDWYRYTRWASTQGQGVALCISTLGLTIATLFG